MPETLPIRLNAHGGYALAEDLSMVLQAVRRYQLVRDSR